MGIGTHLRTQTQPGLPDEPLSGGFEPGRSTGIRYDAAVMNERPGFVAGLGALWSGFGFVLSTPRAWPLAAVPVILLSVITLLLSAAAIFGVPDLIGTLMGPASSTWGAVGTGVLQVVATVAAIVLASLLAFSLAQPLSGPALEGIVRMQERALGAPPRPATSFWTDIARSLTSMLVGYAFGVPLLAVLLVVSVLLPPAAIVTSPLKLLVVAFMLAWDICDYPLSIRGLRIRDRLRVMISFRGAVFGFGVSMALASLLPCLMFLFLPAGVAGAGRLMWSVERWEHTQGRPLQTPPAGG